MKYEWISLFKNGFLDFPRYSGYSIQARWAAVQANDAKFPRDLTHQKSLKSVNFWQSYLKNNKKASIRWQDSARRQFQAGLRGDVGL